MEWRNPILKNMKTILRFTIFVVALAFVSCSPISKDGYLERYDKFITKVQAEYTEYTDADWIALDEEFATLSKVWYAKFQTKLTSDEKSIVTDYEYKYTYYRTLSKGKGVWDALKESYHCDMNRMKEGIVEELKEEAGNFSDAVRSFVDDAANEIKGAIQQTESEMNGIDNKSEQKYNFE